MSPINDPASKALYGEMQKLAEGKLSCVCGNTDWRRFLFVQGGPANIMAGCKRCGRTYDYQPKDSSWLNVGGPAPERK